MSRKAFFENKVFGCPHRPAGVKPFGIADDADRQSRSAPLKYFAMRRDTP
jgi:hypothetical protein